MSRANRGSDIMADEIHPLIELDELPKLKDATLVLAFSGWMDGGDVSTGTVQQLIELLDAEFFASINPDPFYIYNAPGPMEVAALFRPHIEIEDGLVQAIQMPSNDFFFHEESNLALFLGKEPNLRWPTFAECLFKLTEHISVKRILFVGSFGGPIPHTREPKLYVTCSEEALLQEHEKYGMLRSGYEGPGSFTSYLMAEAPGYDLEMISLVAEIPGYLQGTNPMSIDAVARRLATMLNLPIDLDALRSASTQWELQISSLVEEDEELAEKVRQLEKEYDDQLLNE